MFNQARLKLTAWYLLIIMVISISFSVVIYEVLSKEVERFARVQRLRIERRLHTDQNPLYYASSTDPDLVKESKERTILMLTFINGVILLISSGLGYFLAGKTLQPIKEMVDGQNRFISDASHELRTPLTSLKTAMEVSLRDKKLSLPGARTLITESVDEVNKLQSLSDELLQLTQYESPENNLKFEKVSLLTIAKEAIHKIEPIAKQANIIINNNVKDYQVEGNKHELIDLLVILLDNAVKYSPKQTSITLKSKKIDASVIILLSDQGIGISEKDLPHVFDRFYRADFARSKTNRGGYGLGLSIAKKIVNIHRGSITAKSELNKGTTFTVKLPI